MKRSTPPPPCSGTGRGTRRPRPAVHAHGAGGRLHHAGLRPHRRGAFGGVRRLRLGQPGAAHRRCRAQGDRVHRRRFARGQGRALQAAAGPGPGPVQDPAGRRGGVRPWAGALRAGGGRDLDYATLRARHQGARVPVAWLESSEPSYILYTSGTTGKPRACSATPAAMPWRWLLPWSTCSTASRATRTSAPATSAGWWGTRTSSMAR